MTATAPAQTLPDLLLFATVTDLWTWYRATNSRTVQDEIIKALQTHEREEWSEAKNQQTAATAREIRATRPAHLAALFID